MERYKDLSYFTYEVGNNNKQPTKDKKLVWNVMCDENGEVKAINLFEYNWVFLERGLLYAKKHYANDYEKFADEVKISLQHEYWSRCEYELMVGCLFEKDESYYKLDVYTQVMLNWDRFIEYVWNNKRLITKKKLGL